ncbi:lipopolysaccharide biosynthesis protein [Bradyrhizobium sp. 150]|uniref:lipopolysaccharide biosynthesis protein n=1 Tax=Bradyrhizobium sp. 150 TaxID=2782625 RepID=UPI001FFA2DD4|nr:lipopolysaccharide biosynthesis protein [Bradyrhizobium sp. 150]MCK1675307.1 lipopolysaccharide biosynthesis protein [Bradyrhizobium sp. 150]
MSYKDAERVVSVRLDQGRLAGATTYAYANRFASFVISLGSLAILARLLTPHEFGLVAMVATFAGLLTSLRDFGLSAAAIQSIEFSSRDRDSLFWYNAFLTALTSAFVVLAAPLVSDFYRERGLAPLLYLSSAGLLASGLSSVHAALLRRDFNLKGIFFAEIGGLAIGAVVSTLLAYLTESAISVVLGTLAQAVSTSLITFFFGSWVPTMDGAIRSGLHHLIFGVRVGSFTVLNYITNNIGSVAIGYQSGSAAMGFFSRAQNLYALPVSFVLTPYLQVQFPLLCRVQGDLQRTREVYGRLLTLTSMVFIPLAALLPFIAVPGTTLVLGPQWGPAGEILAWLSPSLAAIGLIGPFAQFMTSQGRVVELQWWGVADVVLRGGGALVGSYFGPTYAAAGFSLATLLLAVPIITWITQRDGTFSFADYAKACVPGVLTSLAVGGAAFAVSQFMVGHSFGPLVEPGVILSSAALVWLMLAATFHLSSIQIPSSSSRREN